MQELLKFQKAILEQVINEDGLSVIGEGLGYERILVELVRTYSTNKTLVLLMNCSEIEEEYIQQKLLEMNCGNDDPGRLTVLKSDNSPNQRAKIYLQGGVVSVTNRILVVDIINKIIPTEMVTGIVVNRAHKVTEDSIEAFILKMYRKENCVGFIKAISDKATGFTHEFAGLEKRLKRMQINKVQLWPRYQVNIKEELYGKEREVIEMRQGMSKRMNEIQQCIMECNKKIVMEIKRLNKYVDMSELEIEDWTFKDNEERVRRMLQPFWQRVGARTKRLIADLGDLRRMMEYLVEYDCIKYYEYLEILFTANKMMALGQMRGETGTEPTWIFTDMGNIIYNLAKERAFHTKADGRPQVEVLPKWKTLEKIVEEETSANTRILIMVCNEATREQLSGYLSEADDSKKGLNKCMLKSYKEYMENRLIQKNSNDTEVSSMGNPAGNSGKNNANKRRRVRKTSDSVSGSSGSSVATFAGVIDIDGGTGEQNSQNETTVDPAYYGVVEAQVVIQAYTGIKNMETLEKYRPTTVIMYSPNTEFIRQLEIYGGNIEKVYFMVYDNSVEEQKYLSQIRKEKTSFETLINEKSSMAIQLVDKGITDSPPPISFVSTENDLQPLHQNKTATVIVDAREFRSALPFALYNKGIMVVPRTLLIGDYVLHDQLCVERKAVPDLIQSLASGRLYSQAGAMREHYKSSALLIEFEPNSLFLGDYYFRTERASQLFPVKLAQLLISYKELRLIWSPSPQFTAKLFLDLKSRFPEPDSHRAEQAGKSSVTLTNNYRSSSLKLLNSLPGLSAGTQSLAVYNLANSSKNFTHLCSLSVKQLSSILDPKLASSLHSFLHHTF